MLVGMGTGEMSTSGLLIERPIVLLASERSGGNLLRAILGSHSQIAAPSPVHFLINVDPLLPLVELQVRTAEADHQRLDLSLVVPVGHDIRAPNALCRWQDPQPQSPCRPGAGRPWKGDVSALPYPPNAARWRRRRPFPRH